jgi:hypothetical protein
LLTVYDIRWKGGFGVLTRYGTKLGIPVSKLRVFFIYSTFATAGIFFCFILVGFYALGKGLYHYQKAECF